MASIKEVWLVIFEQKYATYLLLPMLNIDKRIALDAQ